MRTDTMMRRKRLRALRLVRTGATALILTIATSAMALPADSADDVCAPDADPCNVTGIVDVVDGSILDFGVRTVAVTDAGRFRFGAGSGRIRSGSFEASTLGPVIDAVGFEDGGSDSGSIFVEARRLCSAGDQEMPCLDGDDCQLGYCGVRRCSGRTATHCTSDSNCQLVCSSRRCLGSPTYLGCDTNADCNFGTCPEQLTCSDGITYPTACTANADCDFGSCSVGEASMTLDGSIAGRSRNPPRISLRAADSVAIRKSINLSSVYSESDGGELEVEAFAGDIDVDARVFASGGKWAQGGDVELFAGRDVTVRARVNVTGGDFDGGLVDIWAGRDARVDAALLASSTGGAGYGGEIIMTADGDVLIGSGAASRKILLAVSGHTDLENYSGDGGVVDIVAGANVTVGSRVRMVGNGSAPDGFAGDVYVEAGNGQVSFDGDIQFKAEGAYGSGGYVEMDSGGVTMVGESSLFDLNGGSEGGGVLDVDGEGGVHFAGSAELRGANGGAGGDAVLDSVGATTVSGRLTVTGTNEGSIDLRGCRIALATGGELRNKVTGGTNTLSARESITLFPGSLMKADNGTNTLEYRNAAVPPAVDGVVAPAPALVLDAFLEACPVCGNGMIENGETCDDGNAADGDGCSAECQME